MLTHHRLPVCLSVVSTDLPIWFTIETAATLYQKERDRFHLLLREPPLPEWESRHPPQTSPTDVVKRTPQRLLWLEISPYRMIMTMQANGNLSYRHRWERGVYGISRYWLHEKATKKHQSLQLRNYTQMLKLEGYPLPQSLELDYELWSGKVRLGHYLLRLQMYH
ncbi:hypothetical protein [Coleofasciculus sp.]|uniref:hypothetical protein n=1 Tax=Coleofasciculus sp. TaxID=3100458 RepID=UPI003A396BA0